MSAQFILEYGGMPVRFDSARHQLTAETEASKFIAEADAWYAAYQSDLNPSNCRVVNLYERNVVSK